MQKGISTPKHSTVILTGIIILILALYACNNQQEKREVPDSGASTGTDTIWFNQPLRIVQTVLRENDAFDYDVNGVVQYLRDNNANVLVVNAGGIVDFFQNTLPAANLNPFLNGRDLLREIVDACHAENIKVIGRIDFRGVEEHIYRQHPDWFGVNYDGTTQKTDYTTPELYAPCYLSYYRNEHAREFISLLLEDYKLDGIWHNSVHVRGICYCDRCKADYRQRMNKEIPAPDADRKLIGEYYGWKEGAAERHLSDMRSTVKKYGEDKAYAAEVFGMFDVDLPMTSGIDLYSGARYFDFLLSVGFLSNEEDLGYPAGHVRFLKSLAPEKQAVILFGTNGTTSRYIADPVEDLKVWMWETISSGGCLWNCNFTGMHPGTTMDKRNAYLTKIPYQYVEKYQSLLKDQQPFAPVKILYSKATRSYTGNDDPQKDDFGSAVTGMEKVLQEAHLPYGFIPDFRLTASELEGCELLILPNIACLSDQQVKTITEYVEQGGKLLATYSTSLFDENGNQRENFALSSLFGCSFQNQIFDTRKDAYQFITGRNELMSGFENTSMIMNGGKTLGCRQVDPDALTLTKLVPQLNNQPPEKAWKDTLTIESPVIISNSFGKGKVVYFANQPDKLFLETGHQDFSDMLQNAIGSLKPDPLITTDAPESVHVNITKNETEKCFIVSIINMTSAPERPLRRLIPVSDISVTLNLPDGYKLNGHQVLMNTNGFDFRKTTGNNLQINIGKLEDFASVAVFYELL